MIPESAICLDRRVVNPPASQAAGATTWTLPFPVAVDGTDGTLAAVLLDSGEELAGLSRPSDTTVRVVGSYAARPVAIGVRYTTRYVPSVLYFTGDDGRPDRRAPLRLTGVNVHLDRTRHMAATVSVPGRNPYTVQQRTSRPPVGQRFRVLMHAESTQVEWELSTDAPFPATISAIEWSGHFDPQSANRA